jgi:hypothetical protein
MLAQLRCAAELRRLLDREDFDVGLSANTHIDVQAALLKHSHLHGIAFVHWVQDVYFEALRFFLKKRLGMLAQMIGTFRASLRCSGSSNSRQRGSPP